MKLGILCTMINSFGRRGFYNTQEIGLGRALHKRGHEVIIYKCLKQTGGIEPELVEIERGLLIRYLPIKGLGAHGFLDTSVIDTGLDGILCFSDNQVFLPHIYRFCVKHEMGFVPYVGTTYSLHSGLRRRVMDAWFALSTLRIYKNNPVIAKTQGAKEELERLGVTDIRVAPVGLDTVVLKHDFREQDRDAIRAEYGFTPKDVIILDIARMEIEKRPFDMLSIFRNIKGKKGFKLLFVGEGPLKTELKKDIEESGLSYDVKMIDRVPYSDIWKLYTIADYFVCLNKNEIFGMAIMEAIYYETSVVALTSAPGPRLILEDMQGHKLCQDDKEMENWLMAAYPANEDLKSSSEKIEERFSWNCCADTFLKLVEAQRN